MPTTSTMQWKPTLIAFLPHADLFALNLYQWPSAEEATKAMGEVLSTCSNGVCVCVCVDAS